MDSNNSRIILVLLVLLHFFSNIWHAGAHTDLAINLPAYKTAFVAAVILIAPLVGGLFLWTRFKVFGTWLVGLCLLGSFLFSGYHHYILVSIDHVDHLPVGPADIHDWFSHSAVFIEVTALLGALFAFDSLYKKR